MEPTNNLRQAIKDYKSGNGQAFDVLYNESSKYVYTCIYKVMCGNDNTQDAINDIMQDTYVEISRYITQLEDEEKFLSWAGTIATRKCYAYLKKNRKYVLLNEEDTTFDTLADNDNIIPEEIMQDKEKQRLLREIINTELTEMQKLCIIAYYYNEQKQSEIAKELGIPENTVKTNLSRAKAKIKDGVLDLEKKKGTKLYSIAPFMLLLFREEVYAAEVPQQITRNVLSSVSASTLASGAMASAGAEGSGATTANAVSSGVKSVVGKVATNSIKAKVIGGLVGLGVLGAIGGAVYMANKSDEAPTWESEYKEYLLDYDNAIGFDLNDFDEDGIPELLVKSENENIMVYSFDDNEVKEVYELVSYAEENANGLSATMECEYGYGMDYDEILEFDNWTGEYAGETYQMQTMVLYEYADGGLEQTYSAAPSLTGNTDDIQVGYYVTDDGQSNIISLEEGTELVNQSQGNFNEIIYTSIESEEIDIRFEEFKNQGNRQRKQQNSDSEKGVESEEQDVLEEVIEVELSETEKENFRILAQFFTATRWGEDLEGIEIVPTEQNVCDFIGRVANENFEYNQWAYDKYLPTRIAEEEFRQVYTDDSIKNYVMSVFGVELSEINSNMLREENGNYVTMEAQSSSIDKCEIAKAVKEGDTYIVTGSHAFGYYEEVESQEPTYMQTYSFTMELTENEDSPFGYTLNSIKYEWGEGVEAEESNKLKEILLYPEQNIEYYGDGADISDVWFAVADIDKDGKDEIFLAKCYGKKQFGTIYNILKYDKDSNVVTDMDGDRTYEAIGTGQHLYETGILRTCTDISTNNTYFWNLLTGEFWQGPQFKSMDDSVPNSEAKVCVELTCPDGSIVTGEEGNELYESLMSGEELPLEWYEATEENVNRVLQ